ncbi:MAG: FHIPEP family type III secretion protein [Vulcanimicrobiota bacterium]
MAGRKKKDTEAGRESEKSIVEGEKTHEDEHAADIIDYLNLSALTEDTEEQQEKIKCFDLLTIDAISIEVGRGMLPLLEPKEGAELKKQCYSILRHIELELGIVMPGVRFRDNCHLKPGAYVIKIREIEAAEGSVIPGCFIAIGPKERLMRFPGEITTNHNDDLPGKWIANNLRSRAERLGCTLIDPVNVIAGHLGDVCRSHASEFLGFQQVHTLLEKYRKKHPEAVDRVYPALLPLRKIREILQNLVRESLPVRDLVTILEALAMRAVATQNVEKLTEYARAALSREICREYMNSRGEIYAIVLEPEMEKTLTSLLREEDRETFIDEDTDEARPIVSALGEKAALCVEKGLLPVIVCEPPVRPALWKLLVKSHSGLVILSRSEIAPETKVIDWLKNDKNEVTAGAPTSGIRLEKWLASFVFYNGIRYDIKLDEEAEETFIKAIGKGIDMIESLEDSIPIFISSVLYYIFNSSEGGSTLNKKIQERFPRIFISYRDGHSLFKTYRSSMGKISLDAEPPGHKPDLTASS